MRGTPSAARSAATPPATSSSGSESSVPVARARSHVWMVMSLVCSARYSPAVTTSVSRCTRASCGARRQASVAALAKWSQARTRSSPIGLEVVVVPWSCWSWSCWSWLVVLCRAAVCRVRVVVVVVGRVVAGTGQQPGDPPLFVDDVGDEVPRGPLGVGRRCVPVAHGGDAAAELGGRQSLQRDPVGGHGGAPVRPGVPWCSVRDGTARASGGFPSPNLRAPGGRWGLRADGSRVARGWRDAPTAPVARAGECQGPSPGVCPFPPARVSLGAIVLPLRRARLRLSTRLRLRTGGIHGFVNAVSSVSARSLAEPGGRRVSAAPRPGRQ